MKQWLARLFGQTDPPGPAGTAAARDATLPVSSAPVLPAAADADPAIDLLFWYWLCDLPPGDTRSAGAADANDAADAADAARATRLLLDELARLARAPDEAAALVPRVPDVIPRLLSSLRDDATNADLAQQVTRDAVLVAEVIREANTAFYRQATPVRNVDAALRVLGQNGLRMLLARVAFRPVIGVQAGLFARAVAPRLWAHAQACARAGALVAPALGADPFEAYLAGLMIDVGGIVAFRLLDQLQGAGALPRDGARVAAIGAGCRELSARIVLHWGLPPPLGAAILDAGAPDARPLARAVQRADRLARLHLLLEAGVLAPDDPALTALDATAAQALGRLGL